MKKIALIATAVIIGLACSNKKNNQSTIELSAPEQEMTVATISKDITAEEFKSLLTEKNGLLLDVRTPEEFMAGHIEGAENIDYYGDGFDEAINQLDKNQPVFVYCKSGGRSGKTKKILTDKGFAEVYNLIGGYGNWPY